MAGVRKGRGRELGRETTGEGGGKRGTPTRKPLFSPSRLLIKKITKIIIRANLVQRSTQKNAGGGERRAELRRSARRQQFIIKVCS